MGFLLSGSAIALLCWLCCKPDSSNPAWGSYCLVPESILQRLGVGPEKKVGENNVQLRFVRHHVWRTQARLNQKSGQKGRLVKRSLGLKSVGKGKAKNVGMRGVEAERCAWVHG